MAAEHPQPELIPPRRVGLHEPLQRPGQLQQAADLHDQEDGAPPESTLRSVRQQALKGQLLV